MNKVNLITPEDIATFDRIDRDCLKMHVCPPPKTFINMKVQMPDGSLVSELDMVSRSWVRNAYNPSFYMFTGVQTFGSGYQAGSTAQKSTANSVITCRFPAAWLGTSGSNAYGIVVGTGDNAESFESYILETIIANGTSAGQMSYAAQSVQTPVYTVETKKLVQTFVRIFNNNSGGSISVSEVGVIYQDAAGANSLFCRDLLAEAVAVANTAQLTVTYTIEMTFPA